MKNYEFWGKPISEWSTNAILAEISDLICRKDSIKHSEEYSERSDAGDDTLWYQIDAIWEDIYRYTDELERRGIDYFSEYAEEYDED